MKRNDIILVIIILVIAGVGGLWYTSRGKQVAGTVTVTVDGEVFGTYSLDEDQTIQINDTNLLQITDGTADMIDANCPDHTCVDQKAISKNKESIVCLPNKVVVEAHSSEEADIDAVAN